MTIQSDIECNSNGAATFLVLCPFSGVRRLYSKYIHTIIAFATGREAAISENTISTGQANDMAQEAAQ